MGAHQNFSGGSSKFFMGGSPKIFYQVQMSRATRWRHRFEATPTLLRVHFRFWGFKPFPGTNTANAFHQPFFGPNTAAARTRVLNTPYTARAANTASPWRHALWKSRHCLTLTRYMTHISTCLAGLSEANVSISHSGASSCVCLAIVGPAFVYFSHSGARTGYPLYYFRVFRVF